MNTLSVIRNGLILLLCLPLFSWAGDGTRYRIGPGDVLDISVWKTPDLTREVTVMPDGMIRFPLAGELIAGGLSVEELTASLESRLMEFVSDPIINVSIRQINSSMVYVTGKVNNPGRFLLKDRLTVLQVLSLAGGLTPFARSKKIRIIRKAQGGSRMLPFNFKAVSRGEKLEQNIILEQGDVIVVN